MPYSVDSDHNKDNSRTPSEMGLTDQVLYRVASLDASVQTGFRRIDEGMERLRADFHDAQLAVNERISKLDKDVHEQLAFKRARIDGLVKEGAGVREKIEGRITALETWQKVMLARASIVFGAIIALWTFIAPTLRNLLGIANG
jgi:hypothetical protein